MKGQAIKEIEQDFQSKGFEDMELSTQILIKEAKNRNIAVEILDRKENVIKLSHKGKTEYIKQATRTSLDSYVSALLMENKSVTKQILDSKGIKTPKGSLFDEYNLALKHYQILDQTSFVVKPNLTNFGKGITVLNAGFSLDEYSKALDFAFQFDEQVLVEEFVSGKEYRFLVIGGKVLGVLQRIPANVVGDGKSSIATLVEMKNQDSLRGIGYKTPLEKIKLEEVEQQFLKCQGLTENSIPEKGQKVFLRKNSNISTGGDSIDRTDEIPNSYKEIAIRSAEAVGASICGADLIIKDLSEYPDATNHAVIELNFNPAIHIHNFPFKGKNRRVENTILDLLGFEKTVEMVFPISEPNAENQAIAV